MDLARIIAAFVKAQGLAQGFIDWGDKQAAQNPEIAGAWTDTRAVLLQAVDSGTFIPAVTGGLTGAIQALLHGKGELGEDQANIG